MGNREDMTVIEVDRRVAEALSATAAARGVSLNEFLRSVGGLPDDEQPSRGASDGATVDRWLEELASGPAASGSVPADFSRADAYGDHD